MAEIKSEIQALDNASLSSFARRMAQGGAFGWFMEENDITTEETEAAYADLVRELMRRNLVIPSDGDIDMLALARSLASEPEFGDKYDDI